MESRTICTQMAPHRRGARLQPARACWIVEWRGTLARGVLHCVLRCMLRSAMTRGVLMGKATAVELPGARPLCRLLHGCQHGRPTGCRQACLAWGTQRGTEARRRQSRLR